MSCSVAPGCHTKVKRHSFQLIINFMYVHSVTEPGSAGPSDNLRPAPAPAGAVACTFGCAILGLCVRAGVRSEHFQVEIGQIVLTSRHWKPV
jgi:hypothetical protein